MLYTYANRHMLAYKCIYMHACIYVHLYKTQPNPTTVKNRPTQIVFTNPKFWNYQPKAKNEKLNHK